MTLTFEVQCSLFMAILEIASHKKAKQKSLGSLLVLQYALDPYATLFTLTFRGHLRSRARQASYMICLSQKLLSVEMKRETFYGLDLSSSSQGESQDLRVHQGYVCLSRKLAIGTKENFWALF